MIDRPLAINITTGTIVKILLIVGGAYLLYELFNLVLVVLTAIVIASAIEPATRWFTVHRVPRTVAVILVFLAFLTIIFGIFYFFLPVFLPEMITLFSSLSSYADMFSQSSSNVPLLGQSGALSGVVGHLSDTVQQFTTNAFSAASSVFGGVFNFILILVFSFYFSMQERGIEEFLSIITPAEYEQYIISLWRRAQNKIGLWMQGQLLLGIIMATLVFLGLTIVGIKHALPLAVLAGVFEIVPLFGPTLAALPAVAIAFVDGGVGTGFLIIGLYIIFQQFENHLIYPLVVTKVVGVPPLLVILAMIIGAQVAGFLGILLAVPVAAALHEWVADMNEYRLMRTRVAGGQ